jgi:hypothetical protein
MTMKNPPHPGFSVRHDCIEPLGLAITEAVEILGVTRQTLNNLVNGKSASPRQGIRRWRGNLAQASDGLRPCTGPAARRRHQRQTGVATQAARAAPVTYMLCPIRAIRSTKE